MKGHTILRGLSLVLSLGLAQECTALVASGLGGRRLIIRNSYADKNLDKREAPLQGIVTWDGNSLFVHGERVMIFSGEIHPFRLPVPSLWLDLFEKVKALGLNTVSFYVNWAQLEGKPGTFRSEGVLEYEKFFQAAKEAGVYLIARPGPYINAEVSGGGFPGWLQRVKGHGRTADPDFLDATDNYIAHIDRIIAKYQITNGGPVILYQPENEYTGAAPGFTFPDPDYFQYVMDQAREAGIVVPFISNDASVDGHNAPGTGKGEVDIYGHDDYPLLFDCGQPSVWPTRKWKTDWYQKHMEISPSTPYTIPEFQGGSFDPWGGYGFEQCSALVNHEASRVLYKNLYAAGISIFNVYMLFGGTNWGNLGHPGGYTSYDYAAAIAEDRTVTREKYSELKLQANFMKSSPGYLTATPETSPKIGVYSSNLEIAVTPVVGTEGSFWVVRHDVFYSINTTPYTLTLPTSKGEVTIPQLGGALTLSRRDSKIHVTDFPLSYGDSLVYSTAEIFTWKKFGDKTVLVVYGGPDELHEIGINTKASKWNVKGDGLKVKKVDAGYIVAQWETKTERRVLQVGDLHVFIIDRNSAYNYWTPELKSGSSSSSSSLIVNGGYLVRSASSRGNSLYLRADLNTTTSLEIIGVPAGVKKLYVNDEPVKYKTNGEGNWVISEKALYKSPDISLPELSELEWNYIDSLPEVRKGYDDSAWPDADHTTTNNSYIQPQLTPTSLFASDYGFHSGVLFYRGHFVASGAESQFNITTKGGTAFASSVWLGDTFIGSWIGNGQSLANNDTYSLPALKKGTSHVFTVIIDNMGLDDNWVIGEDKMKNPRGILNYALLSSFSQSPLDTAITWKITGNLGGEDSADPSRGPLNEGGLYHERQGLHLPNPPLKRFSSSKKQTPFTGLASAGIAFYTTKFHLDLPTAQFDTPLRFAFTNDTAASAASAQPYRAWLYVNGFQFGRYVSHLGPQTEFPVPEGILNYNGENWIGVAVWAPTEAGARVPGLELKAKTPIWTGRKRGSGKGVEVPGWRERKGAY